LPFEIECPDIMLFAQLVQHTGIELGDAAP
jgi:hypothetical protein